MAGMNWFTYNTPHGKLTLVSDGRALTQVIPGEQSLSCPSEPTSLTNHAATEIQEYFAGRRRMFDIPLHPSGTEFQREVWRAIELIPYGQTRTYAQIADAIGRPGSARAVGSAARVNPLPIVIPCHRIVPASGGIGGYAYGPEMKRFLLELEHRNS